MTVGRGPEVAITRRSFRQLIVGAAICAVVFGGTAASSALSYVGSFPTEASRQQLVATTSSDQGLSVLLGPVATIGTVGGYTVYKGFAFLTTIGAIWALLAANRLLRGEEDAGRWELLLAGRTRPGRATMATVVALLGAVAVVFAGATVIVLLAALDPDLGFGVGETVLYGLSLVVPAAVFVGVGAVTSQLGRTRRTANGLGMVVLAVAWVLRMVADASPDTRWLRWATPFGWTERMAPFTQNDPWPLLPATAAVVVLVSVAFVLVSRRDLGAGVISSADVAAPRSFGLGSTWGLAARLEVPILAAWGLGVVATGLSLGFIAKMTEASVPASLGDTLDKFGVHGSFADQYLGVAFLLVATVVALIPAGQLGAAADEQTSGRLVQVLAGRPRRPTWFAERLALAALGVVAAGLLAGLATWAGAASQGVHLGLGDLVVAGLNVVPTALLALGLGAVVLALAPRAASTAVYVVVGWSLIGDLLASMVSGLAWLDRFTLLHYLALAPAEDVDPATLAAVTAVAVALGAVATAAFARRDLQTA
ncbi:hypothetical protein [Aquihabitans sp. McL0605]|uniref:hypothetical protein n=1 Tax=Aquihabitans sp. McL0605 TaxID=3415671 RepID=UPI003CF2D4AA